MATFNLVPFRSGAFSSVARAARAPSFFNENDPFASPSVQDEDSGFLGFLGKVGRTLDIGTGAAFIRNIVSGEWSKALTTLPGLGLFTAPDRNYATSGKEIVSGVFDAVGLPKGRISDVIPFAFGAPGSGSLLERGGFFDWTARGTAGFVTEMIMDPATYVGIGALTRTGRALQLAGKSRKAVSGVLATAAVPGGLERLPPALRRAVPILEKIPEEARFLAPTIHDQVATGQRSLLSLNIPFTNFSGPRIPVPFLSLPREVGLFQRVSRLGQAIRQGPIGKIFLNKPGSSTGFQTYNESFKQVIGRLKGGQLLDREESLRVMNEIYNVAKAADPNVTRDSEALAKIAESVTYAWERTDAYKKLPEGLKKVTGQLRAINDDLLRRDIQAGVQISNLGDFHAESLTRLMDQQDAVIAGGFQDISNTVVGRYAQGTEKIQGLQRKVARAERIAISKTAKVLGDQLNKFDDQFIKLLDDPAANVRGYEKSLEALRNKGRELEPEWIAEANKSADLQARTNRFDEVDAELREVDRTILLQEEALQRNLLAKQRTSKQQARDLEKVIKVEEKVLRGRRTVDALRKLNPKFGNIDDLRRIEGVDPTFIRDATDVARSSVRHLLQEIRWEHARMTKLQQFSNRLLLDIAPDQLDDPNLVRQLLDIGEGELTGEISEEVGEAIGQLRPPKPIRSDVSRTTSRVNRTVARVQKQIDDLYTRAPKTDYYVAHIPTAAAQEWLQDNFPKLFKGGARLWTPDHASTLKRMIPDDIHTVNEKMHKVLDGNDFFETNPGVILMTRAGRTRRAEALVDYARGLTEIDGVSVHAQDALRRAAAISPEGALARQLRPGEIVAEVSEEVSQKRLNRLIDDVFGKTDKAGNLVKAKRGQWTKSLDEIDGILKRSGSGLRIPENPKIRELWRRQGIDPVAVPEEIARDTALFGDIFSGSGPVFDNFTKMVAAWTRPWKSFTLFPWPSYHTRNFYSEHFLNFIQGMTNPIEYGKHSMNALWLNMMEMKLDRALRKGDAARAAGKVDAANGFFAERTRIETALRDRIFTTKHGEVSGLDVLEQYRINGLDDGYSRQAREYITPTDELRSRVELIKELRRARKDPEARGALGQWVKSMVRDPAAIPIVRKYETVINKVADVTGRWTEKHPRMTQFLWELENQGRGFDDAALEVVKRHYDYNSLAFTSFENKLRQTLIPFFSWQRQNVPRMIKDFLGTPRRPIAVTRLSENQFTDEEKESLPRYIRESVKIRIGKDQVIHRIGLPFEDILEWAQDPIRKIVLSTHPVGQEIIRQATGVDVFTGKPPQPFMGTGTAPLPAPFEIPLRTFGGRVQTLLRRRRQVARGELDLSTEVAAGLSGLKPRPFDPRNARLETLREKVRALVEEGRARETTIPFVPKGTEDDEARAILSEFGQLARETARRRRVEAGEEEERPRRRRRRRRRKKKKGGT